MSRTLMSRRQPLQRSPSALLFTGLLAVVPAMAQDSEFALQGLGGMWVNGYDASIYLQQRSDHWTMAYAEFSSVLLSRCTEAEGKLLCEGQGRDAEGRDFNYRGSFAVGSIPLQRGDGTALLESWVIQYRQQAGASLNTLRGDAVFTRPGDNVNAHYARQHFLADEDVVIEPE